jgi:hypothetical protein
MPSTPVHVGCARHALRDTLVFLFVRLASSFSSNLEPRNDESRQVSQAAFGIFECRSY